MAKKIVVKNKADNLTYNKGKGEGKKIGLKNGIKIGKKKGWFYGILSALLIGAVLGGIGFGVYTGVDYALNKSKTPADYIKVTELGAIKLNTGDSQPTYSQLLSALVSKNPDISSSDFKIKDIKVNGANGTAKVVSNHYWVKGSVEISFTVTT